MTDKAQANFLLSPSEKALFVSLARYHEITMSDLLRDWIYEEATEILTPMVDEAVKLGIAEETKETMLDQLRKQEIQVHLESMDAGHILVGVLEAS